jgi:DNA polymerase-3 subunit alpha
VSEKSFVHLHNHADGSQLDGLAQIKKLVPAAEALGMPAIAITDHGSMSATYELYKATKGTGVKPIYGIEAYVAPAVPRTHKEAVRWNEGGDDDVSGAGAYTHMTMWAETNEGLHNLFKISSEAYLTGFYRKPRCLLPGQEIMTKSGMKAIENIVVGDEVLTHLGRFRRVTETMKNRHAGTIFGIELGSRYSRVTWMTGEHPVRIRNKKGEIEWVEAQNILPGRPSNNANEAGDNWNSWVCLPRVNFPEYALTAITVSDYVTSWVPEFDESERWVKTSERPTNKSGPTRHYANFPTTIELDADFGELLGLYISEGHIDRGHTVTFSYHEDENALIRRTQDLLFKFTGKVASINLRADRTNYHGVDVSLSSSILCELLAHLCGSGSASRKHMPDLVFDSSEHFAKAVWLGVLAGDGSKAHPSVVSLEQTSEQLHWQMRTLAARFSEDFANTYLKTPDKAVHAQSYRSNYTIGKTRDFRHTLSDDENVYKPVVAIQSREYDGWVYNIEVEEDHTYVSDFAIHNCDEDLLREFHHGIIATTGCPSGEVQTWLRIGNYEKAKAAAKKFADIFGEGNYFVELMDHGLDIEKRVIGDLLRIAKELNLPTVATNDLHYVHQSDNVVHDALLCIGSGSKLHDEKRFRFDAKDFYLKTAAEMRAIWDPIAPDACDNTLKIAERCVATFEDGIDLMPTFDVPEGETEASWLEKEVNAGLERRYPEGVPEDRVKQAAYEVGIINQMGFPGYFLVTADFINWAKENGIRVGPGRGSAAGSLIAYAMGITDIDPMRHGLMFERFLNPERVSMPDIDVDFDDRKRGQVIEYVIEKYGADKVANITTFQSVKAKAAIKDAARVMDMPYMLGDKLTKVYPQPIVGRDLSLADAYDPANERYEEAAEFRNMVEADPDAKAVVALARGLEGVKRGHGMHAAGVIMSRRPLVETVPLMKRDANSPVMTQFEYPTCEYLGLLKMDFLGLSNLGTLDEALRLIKINRGEDVDLDQIGRDLNDQKTFDMVARGETLGVFQLDSPPMRSLLKLMVPDSFEDISAVLALYRPGPMGAGAHIEYADRKNGRRPIVPIHRELATGPLPEILGDTYGVIVYQEQVMAIAQQLAGYTLGGADLLRRAMGKKDPKILAKEFEPFSAGMKSNGYSEEAIRTLWEILVPFSDYAFNRAHTAGYGLVSYWTAYLKANYPAEYMAALLTTNADNKEKLALYLGECRRMGVKVLPPDVNQSELNYTSVGKDIRVGLIGVKGVGENAIQTWLDERAEKGSAKSFGDYLERAETQMSGKKAVEALVRAGAFDCFGHTRAALHAVHEAACEQARKAKKKKTKSDDLVSLFDDTMMDTSLQIDIPEVPEWERMDKLARERDVLGLYVSDHPLAELADAIDVLSTHSIAYLRDVENPPADVVKIAGLVTSVDRKVTKKSGEPWAIVNVEDLDSSISVYVFPRTYADVQDLLKSDAILVFSGRAEKRDDGATTFAVRDVIQPDLKAAQRKAARLAAQAAEGGEPVKKETMASVTPSGYQDDGNTNPVRIKVDENQLTESAANKLRLIIGEFHGSRPVHMAMTRADGTVAEFVLGAEYTVVGTAQFAAEVRALFGSESV